MIDVRTIPLPSQNGVPQPGPRSRVRVQSDSRQRRRSRCTTFARPLFRALAFVRRYRLHAGAAVLAVLIASLADLAQPQILRSIVDNGIVGGDTRAITRGIGALIAMSAAGGVASFIQGVLTAKATHGAAFEMRDAIFDKLQRLSFSYHDTAQSGQLITRVTSDVDLVRDFVGGGLVQVFSAVILLIGAVVVLLSMDAGLAVLSFLVVPATIVILLTFVRKLGPMFKEFQVRLSVLNTVLQENVAGVRVVRAFAREPFEAERFDRANTSLLEQGMVVRSVVANAFPLLFSVGTIGVGLVTWAGALRIVSGNLSVGELVAFTGYLHLLLQPLFIIGFGASQIARAGASAERLFEVLDARVEVEDAADAIELPAGRADVEFRAVTLRYPGDDRTTLEDLSFHVADGETVALVGATGSGKSSIVNLIPRFYDVTGGAVLVGGVDVRSVRIDSLRRAVGVVMQDSVLFSSSVSENIAYGRPDATDLEIESASRAAQAHEFITALPDGYATRVGERGVRLSGGQRQRIAIARALLVAPRLLIMDDSTSAIDARTETALRATMQQLMHGRTTFVVAQRLSTVRAADRILLIEGGRLVASGTHDELLATSCLYAEIASSQLVDSAEVSI